MMEALKMAIDAAYQAEVETLYKVLSQSILAAGGDPEEIGTARARFKKGLAHAANVRQLAGETAGVEGTSGKAAATRKPGRAI